MVVLGKGWWGCMGLPHRMNRIWVGVLLPAAIFCWGGGGSGARVSTVVPFGTEGVTLCGCWAIAELCALTLRSLQAHWKLAANCSAFTKRLVSF